MKMAHVVQQDRCHAIVINVGYTLVYDDGCQDIHSANSEPADGEQEASISSTLKRRLSKLAAAEFVERQGYIICGSLTRRLEC